MSESNNLSSCPRSSSIEIGQLQAQNKPVVLLKEKTVKALQADLMGKLYKQFEEHDPHGTIPEQLETWLRDNVL